MQFFLTAITKLLQHTLQQPWGFSGYAKTLRHFLELGVTCTLVKKIKEYFMQVENVRIVYCYTKCAFFRNHFHFISWVLFVKFMISIPEAVTVGSNRGVSLTFNNGRPHQLAFYQCSFNVLGCTLA